MLRVRDRVTAIDRAAADTPSDAPQELYERTALVFAARFDRSDARVERFERIELRMAAIEKVAQRERNLQGLRDAPAIPATASRRWAGRA